MVCADREQEVWKQYPDYDFIEVSNFGKVRTKDHYVTCKNGRKIFVKGKVLKQWHDKDGYMQVSFGANGKAIHLKVHRAVAASHLPNPNNYPEVNHIDCDRTNNRLDNLEWCTHQENITYRDKIGNYVNNNPGHPVIAINLDTLEVSYFESQREAERQLGISHSSISKVVKGKQNKAGGYLFYDADENAIEKIRDKFGNEVTREVEKLMCES